METRRTSQGHGVRVDGFFSPCYSPGPTAISPRVTEKATRRERPPTEVEWIVPYPHPCGWEGCLCPQGPLTSGSCTICTSLAGSWEIRKECSPEHTLPLALLTTGPKPTPQTQGPSFKRNLLRNAQGRLELTKTSKDKIQHLPSECHLPDVLGMTFCFTPLTIGWRAFHSPQQMGKPKLMGRNAGTCSIHRNEEAKGWDWVSSLLAATQVLNVSHTASYLVLLSIPSALRVSTSNQERVRRWLNG